jgi:DDE family transposase
MQWRDIGSDLDTIEELLADKIYCTRENRKQLKLLGIKLKAKPLGRPTAVEAHVSPGERNPIEGKFGQAKRKYGMGRIKARLAQTSESWIASIIMVLNLVNPAGQVVFTLLSTLSAYVITLINDGLMRRKALAGRTLLFSRPYV